MKIVFGYTASSSNSQTKVETSDYNTIHYAYGTLLGNNSEVIAYQKKFHWVHEKVEYTKFDILP
jgi:hypothetical protein